MTSSTTVPVSSQLSAPAAASRERFDLHRRVLVISFHYLQAPSAEIMPCFRAANPALKHIACA
ncbi:hypothetical protein IUJ34_11415 [Klebsiella pneumoniae subsp. pneumoniae]|uniref:Uncharacterized protein n=1 Tax=Klebsiella pneumoniae subsp. pneumoniae TaxID=72407 RepID=A0A7S9E1L5_KLEPN|nr:hypothetical protein [Klebsiella pneumoniae]QPG07802.1 hypothetical protein IUJ34_11415 [Klebsiella pneumoniae subsp. pneumoniae]QQU39018.1 hypothetical protein I6I33_11390 [Klebsiella pneumoniae]